MSDRTIAVALALLLTGIAAEASATATLTLMSYNLHSGIPMGFNSRNYTVTHKDLRNLAEVVTSASADVVAMQEVQCELQLLKPEKQATSALNETRIMAGLADLRYIFASTLDDKPGFPENTNYLEWGTADCWTNNGGFHGEFGNSILSRYEFETPPESTPLPMLPQQERRGYIRAKLKESATSGTPVVIYATHLQHDNAETRVEQLTAILKRASAEPAGTTVFILGDLNYAAGAKQGNLMELAQKNGFHDLHDEYGKERGVKPEFTFPADKPDRRIDFILCNQPLHVTEAHVPNTMASDHRPIVLTVELGNR